MNALCTSQQLARPPKKGLEVSLHTRTQQFLTRFFSFNTDLLQNYKNFVDYIPQTKDLWGLRSDL